MDPDRSSRVAARRIVEEVLADHAARATALDDATPVRIVERPDTPSWRAARRIVEETLAEHAARAVVPSAMRLDVVVDLDNEDVEVVVDLDGHEPATEPGSGQGMAADASDAPDPSVASAGGPIERDETPAKAARRVVEGVLTGREIDPDAPTDPDDAPVAFEIDPIPEAPAEPPEPVTTPLAATAVAPAVESSETDHPDDPADPDLADVTGPIGAAEGEDGSIEAHEGSAEDDADGQAVPVDDARLRAAIPERLFEPEPEPEPEPTEADTTEADTSEADTTEADTTLDEPSVLDAPGIAPPVDGPPPPRTPDAVPPAHLDPDAPVAIAARIVAGVLADQERAAQEARDEQQARDAELAALETEPSGSEPPAQAGTPTPDAEPGTGPVTVEGSESQPSGVPEGWVAVPSAPERGGARSSSGVMIVDTDVEDLVLDPMASDQRVDDRPATEGDDAWMGQEAVDRVAEDEFGAWPDPIVPPRRTGRWLITTVLGALLLALLLPLAIGALRDLVSFS